jgi:hypothetical protein
MRCGAAVRCGVVQYSSSASQPTEYSMLETLYAAVRRERSRFGLAPRIRLHRHFTTEKGY